MTRALGTDDSINTCDCCGRANLKFTVIIELDDGEIAHYGQVCASRNTGKSSSVIASEIKNEAERNLNLAKSELHCTTEWLALQAKINQRPLSLIGKAAKEFIANELEAEREVRCKIATKYGLEPFQIA